MSYECLVSAYQNFIFEESVQCLLQSVQCLGKSVLCLLESVQCLLESVQCLLESVQCILESVLCLVESVYCLVEIVQCLIESVQCLLQSVLCLPESVSCLISKCLVSSQKVSSVYPIFARQLPVCSKAQISPDFWSLSGCDHRHANFSGNRFLQLLLDLAGATQKKKTSSIRFFFSFHAKGAEPSRLCFYYHATRVELHLGNLD